MERKSITRVHITNTQRTKKEVDSNDIIKFNTTESIDKYAGTFELTIDNTKGKNSKLCEPKDEIEIWRGSKETGFKKLMGGFIGRVILQRDEDARSTILIQGRSYASCLLDARISGRIQFTKGYSQVLREILKNTPLKLDGIRDSKGEGEIVFRNACLIDIIRQLAENIGWIFRVDHDKVFHFEPISPYKHSGVTLTEKGIKAFKIIKESK